jgi:hypothetical protein
VTAQPSCPTPPEPKSGGRQVIKMILKNNEKESVIRVLLDCGATIPILNKKWALRNNIPTFERTEPKVVESFAGKIEPEIRLAYTYPVRLQHRKLFSVESFEIGPTDNECDAILPFWWIVKHPPLNLLRNPENIQFVQCQNCTEASSNEFSLQMDSNILDHLVAMVIGSISTKEDNIDPISLVPAKFRKWVHIMTKEAAATLPEHKPYDHAIDIKDCETPPWGPCYALSEKELEVLRDWLKDMLETGKIRRSKSPARSPILFVPKAHGRGLRLCVDYRELNKITIANRYHLPIMSKLQDRIRGARIFTNLDLKIGYHLIRVKKGDEWKTAFRCRYGLYKFIVMPFGLTNAPATFQDMMNHILKNLLDEGVVVYIDDVLIYAKMEETHDLLVKEVIK